MCLAQDDLLGAAQRMLYGYKDAGITNSNNECRLQYRRRWNSLDSAIVTGIKPDAGGWIKIATQVRPDPSVLANEGIDTLLYQVRDSATRHKHFSCAPVRNS